MVLLILFTLLAVVITAYICFSDGEYGFGVLLWSSIALAITVFAIVAISFSIAVGASYLVCWAFGIAWSFKIAFGVWCLLALVSMFLKSNSKKD